jgi:hypothetical protein
MAARDSEFPQRVARLKSALGELVEETDAISQRARRRNTGKIARVSAPILPRVDLPFDAPHAEPAEGESETEGESESESRIARAATEPPPPPAPSAPPDPSASRYSIVSPPTSRHSKKP